MELLFLLLLVPVAWLILLPLRLAGALKRHRYASVAAIAAVALGTLMLLHLAQPVDQPADYAQGDTALRALLE